MISKLTVGNGLRGAVTYDFSHKKGEANRAEWIGGTLGGIGATPKQVSRQGGLLRALRPEIKNPIWRCSLSLPPSDGRRDGVFWRQIVEEFLMEMDIPLDAGWLAVRHDDVAHDHVHLTVIRILPNSKLWNRANDLPKAIKATQKIERLHGLAMHSREKPKKSSPTLADRQISQRKSNPMCKTYVQNAIDSIFNNHSVGLAVEKLQAQLEEKGIDLEEKRTKQGKLQGLSFRYDNVSFPASALGSEYGTSGLIRRGLLIKDQIHYVNSGDVDVLGEKLKTASKMPAALKPLILPAHFSVKQIKPHATQPHQTESMVADSPTFKLAPIQYLPMSEVNAVMAMIGSACLNLSLAIFKLILNFISAILHRFGFGIQVAVEQPSVSSSHQLPLYYSPTQPQQALPTPTAEHLAAQKLFCVAKALEKNDSSLLPIVDGEAAAIARAELVDAMDERGGNGGGGVGAADTENFSFIAEDFVSINAVSSPPKIDLLDELKAAVLVHEEAAKLLRYGQVKKGPIHFSTVHKIEAELKLVRTELQTARDKWQQYCGDFPIKSKFPSPKKALLLAGVAKSEREEKNVLFSIKKAEAEDSRIDKIYAALPEAVVPTAVLQAEAEAREAIKTTREAIQIEALDSIKVVKSDPMMLPKMAKFESLLSSSFKYFNETRRLTVIDISVLESQIQELRRLRHVQEAAQRAAAADFDCDADKPVIYDHKVK